MIRAAGILSALLLLAAAPAAACRADGFGSALLKGERAVISLHLEPDPPRVDGFFSIDATVCDSAGEPARLYYVDAIMPAHGHGMNYRPEIADLGKGRYRITGMLFHMQGGWRLRFDVETKAGAERLTAPVDATF